jgi:hypothetical protein
MAKDDELHRDADRWGFGRTSGNRRGAGAYTETDKEALARLKRGNLVGDGAVRIDRSDSPNKRPYGSFHYPSK